ncbi:MAG: phage tail protein, partial [Limnohabitans sp.]
PNNTLAWANDTGNVFTYVNNRGWIGLNTGLDDPIPVGAMMDFPTRAIPNGWLECNGQAIPADGKYDELRALLGGTTVPDLRGYFSRAANAGQALLSKTAWTTGRPRTALTGTTGTDGDHSHTYQRAVTGIDQNINAYSANNNDGGQTPTATTTNGAHSHTVTINGGGDAETAPDHYATVRCIKAFHITATVPGPDRMLTAFVAPSAGQTVSYDATTGSWANESKGIVGSIVQSLLSEAQFMAAAGHDAVNWVLADGRSVAGSRYAQITGSATVPDLRGAFFRAAGQNSNNQANWNGGTVGSSHDDTTRMPRTAFTTATAGSHSHGLTNGASYVKTSGGGHDLQPGASGAAEGTSTFSTDGNHTHTINGGDAETAPVHYSLNTFLRIN